MNDAGRVRSTRMVRESVAGLDILSMNVTYVEADGLLLREDRQDASSR